MIAFIATVLAQIPTAPATPASAVDFTWLFLKMLLILAIVSILAVLILKYAVPRTGLLSRFRRGAFATVHARQAIEPRKALYLVEIAHRYLVLGVSDHAISLVAELSAADVERIMKE